MLCVGYPSRPHSPGAQAVRVLVALITCKLPSYQANRWRCEETWAKWLPAGWDFIAVDGDTFQTGDGYDSLSDKVQWTCRFAEKGGYDWLLKADDDVWLKTSQLRIPDREYAGHVLFHPNFDYCAGGCYWLSRAAVQIVASATRNTVNTSAEDQWVGRMMWDEGIRPLDLWEFALEPCSCANCPKTIPKNWTAYIGRKSGQPPRTYPPEHYPTS